MKGWQHMTLNHRSIIFSAPLLLLALWPGQIVAQEKTDPEMVEEAITVTARKREEVAIEIPESMTILDQATIQDAGLEQLSEIAWLVPNLNLLDGSHTGNITMTVRGITQVRNGEPPMAFVIDGVNQPSPNALNRDFYDIEQVEVLRGPQGALYGRNAIGGAVVVTTKQPTGRHEQAFSLGAGSGEYLQGGFRASGPLSDRAYYSVSTNYEDRDGFIRNTFLDETVDPYRNESYNLRLSFLPSDRLDIDIKAYYSDINAGGLYYIPLPDNNANNTSVPVMMDEAGDNRQENSELSAKIEYRADAFSITSITAYHDLDEIIYGDIDYTVSPFLRGFQDLVTDGLSQEFRVASKDDQRLRWMVGAYYLTYDRQVETSIDVNTQGNGYDFVFATTEANDNETTAFFGQVNYDLNDRLELSVAMRYDEDDREQTNVLTGDVRSDSFSSTQPKGSIAYQFSDHAMVYATYAEGFRSGGFNSPGRASFSEKYEKEETQNFDLGYKTSLFDGRVMFNATYYRLDADNLQTIIFDQLTATQGIINIQGAETQGIEVDLSAKLSRNWQFALGYGSTDSEITALDTSAPFYTNFPGDVQFIGNKLPNTPDYTLNASLQFSAPLMGDVRFQLRGDYQHIDTLYWQTDNQDFRRPLDLGRARVGLKAPDWSFTFWVENLTDERYSEEFFTVEYGAAQDNSFPTTPRHWGVEYRRRF